jgi:hypothetical protein
MRDRPRRYSPELGNAFTVPDSPAHSGTCTAAGGLDTETFCGFELAEKLFLLTSSFIVAGRYSQADKAETRHRGGHCRLVSSTREIIN